MKYGPSYFRFLALSFCSFLLLSLASAQSRAEGGDTSLALTHILAPAFVVPGGDLVLGTTAAYGLFDVADIESNLFLDILQVFNITGKVSLWAGHNFAAAVLLGYETQQLKTYDQFGNIYTQNSSAVMPGAVVSYRFGSNFTGHSGATIVNGTPSINKSQLSQRDGFILGTTVNQEFTVGLSRMVAVSTGFSYDIPYDISGAGLSLHIGTFQIGAQYFFNVNVDSLLPIVGGSFSTTY